MEALGGKAVSTPNKARSSEHWLCVPFISPLPMYTDAELPFTDLDVELMPSIFYEKAFKWTVMSVRKMLRGILLHNIESYNNLGKFPSGS